MSDLTTFPKVYLDIMHDMMAHGVTINAQTTVEALKNLYFQRKKVAAIEDETKFDNELFKICHMEVDKGFCRTKNSVDRLHEINAKLQLLIDAYEDAKKNNYVDHFFSSAFESDSHLNHRLEHLEKFFKEHKGKKVSQKV